MRNGRTNLLEELGRVEGEHSNKNRRAEVARIHGELNKAMLKVEDLVMVLVVQFLKAKKSVSK